MTFTKSVTLPVTPDEAFALVTQPERLRRWKTVSAYVDLRAGGEYRYTVTPGHHASGTFREIEPGRRIVFGWGWDEDPNLPPDASTVTITIEPDGDGCILTLEHAGLTPEQAVAHAEGWKHFMGRLEKLATTGEAGPDEWSWAPDPLTPLVAAEATLAVLQPVLRGLTTADRERQTPCTEFSCHDLAEHLFDSLTQLGLMAGVKVVDPDHAGLEEKISSMSEQVLKAWRGMDLTGPVLDRDLPAAVAVKIPAIEFLLHAWDFAQASGQEVLVSDEVVAYVTELAHDVVPGARGRAFGPEVDAPADADPLTRLAAYTGRSPLAA